MERVQEFGQVSVGQLWREQSDLATIRAALGRLMYEDRISIPPNALDILFFASHEAAQLDWELTSDDDPERLAGRHLMRCETGKICYRTEAEVEVAVDRHNADEGFSTLQSPPSTQGARHRP
jgi:hypothetical protein